MVPGCICIYISSCPTLPCNPQYPFQLANMVPRTKHINLNASSPFRVLYKMVVNWLLEVLQSLRSGTPQYCQGVVAGFQSRNSEGFMMGVCGWLVGKLAAGGVHRPLLPLSFQLMEFGRCYLAGHLEACLYQPLHQPATSTLKLCRPQLQLSLSLHSNGPRHNTSLCGKGEHQN